MGALFNGLTAFANAGTGYFNAQNQNQQRNYQNQMQALALHNAQQKDAQNTKSIQDAQASSDDAMAVSAGLVPANKGMPGQTTPSQGDTGAAPPQQQDPVQGFIDYNTKMAQLAVGRGDDLGYQQHMTNAINARNDQAAQSAKQASTALNNTKAQQDEIQMIGNLAGGVTDQASYDSFRQQLMASGNPIARQKAASLPQAYSPEITSGIAQGALTAYQRIEAQQRQIKDSATQAHEKFMEQNDTQKLDLDRRRTEATIEHQKNQTKAGAVDKAPSSQELKVAAPLIAQALFPGNSDAADTESLMQGPGYNPGANGKETKYDFNSPMITTIVGRAKQAMKGNRALTFNQAVAQQAQMAKDSGEFTQTTTPAKMGIAGGPDSWGAKPASTSSKFNAGDGSASNPLVFTGQKPDQLEDGKHYKTASGDMIWSKTGWIHP